MRNILWQKLAQKGLLNQLFHIYNDCWITNNLSSCFCNWWILKRSPDFMKIKKTSHDIGFLDAELAENSQDISYRKNIVSFSENIITKSSNLGIIMSFWADTSHKELTALRTKSCFYMIFAHIKWKLKNNWTPVLMWLF